MKSGNGDCINPATKAYTAQVFFQWKSLAAPPRLGTGDAAGDELMNWCVHARDLMGALRVKQAETCTVTL